MRLDSESTWQEAERGSISPDSLLALEWRCVQVWKVVRCADKQTYAIKEVDLGGLTRKEQEDCVREVHVLARMDCPYIIKYFDCFMEDSKLYIVTEYAPGVHRSAIRFVHTCMHHLPAMYVCCIHNWHSGNSPSL
jgi:serine/threonine protein kinase